MQAHRGNGVGILVPMLRVGTRGQGDPAPEAHIQNEHQVVFRTTRERRRIAFPCGAWERGKTRRASPQAKRFAFLHVLLFAACGTHLVFDNFEQARADFFQPPLVLDLAVLLVGDVKHVDNLVEEGADFRPSHR
jgi:hypothetical protein